MKNIKTEWNLGLLYKNNKDPQIEKDIQAIEKACSDFEKKYKNKDFISSEAKLLKALKDDEILAKKLSGRKPWWYFALKGQLNSSDAVAGALSTKIGERIRKATNKLTFFELALAKIPKSEQKKILKNPQFETYWYSLSLIFKNAEYNLSEGEEQMIRLLSDTSYNMWVDGQQRVLNEQTIEHKGKKISFPEANSIFSDLPKEERRELYSKINEVTKSIAHFADAEINAIYNYKKVLDERRGYKKPYSSSLLNDEMDEKTIELLVNLVTKSSYISKRFYKVHAKLLGEKKITYADRSTAIGQIKKKFTFPESARIVKETFAKIDPKFADIFEGFLVNGQIDVNSKVGKSGGAFCWGMGDLPTFVLLNHSDNIRSVETLAHEMGHAIHTELSKPQPPQYQHYTMPVAEVASTFFEQIVTEELENYLSDDEKLILLHNKIRGDIQVIFRQIACFNFELELHEQIRAKGQVPKGDIADMLSKHMRAYMGDAVEISHDDGYFFVQWSHIRRYFYVYSYAYGQLISRALFENWKKDPSYIQKVEQFLSAGKSMSPYDIFKKIGIDTADPKFFESGLKGIEKDLARLEKMARIKK